MKPTRLAAAEFEANQIRWGLGAEGGVLETASEDEDELEGDLVEEEAAR